METAYLLFYLLAGVCFGLVAGRVTTKSIDFLGLGLLLFSLPLIAQSLATV